MSMSSGRKAPSLTSLPLEILSQICRSLDTPSALAFALVSRCCTAPAEYGIYCGLILSIRSDYPERPRAKDADTEAWAEGAKADREACRTRLRMRAREMLQRLDKRRCMMVEGVKVVPRTGSHLSTLSFLEYLSPTIQSLEIDDPLDKTHYGAALDVQGHDTLDYHFLMSDLSFPSLHTLRLGPSAVRYWGFVPLLLTAAPSIHTLDLDLTYDFREDLGRRVQPRFPPTPTTTKIRRLRIFVRVPWDDDYEGELDPVLEFLGRCPALKQVALNIDGDHDQDNKILDILSQCEDIEDIYWPIPPDRFCWALNKVSGDFGEVRRLTLRASKDIEFFGNPPELNLEAIFIRCPPSYSQSTYLPPLPLPAQYTVPRVVMDIGEMPTPSIHFIRGEEISDDSLDLFAQLDQIEASGKTGYARRIRPNRPDTMALPVLLHVRLLLDHYELSDEPDPDYRAEHTPGPAVIQYERYEGDCGPRIKHFQRTAEPIWQDFTDYEAEAVPLEVFEQMRVVEGVSEEEWAKRDILVKEETWKVLTDWYTKRQEEITATAAADKRGIEQ